jgi:hypothetical protein
MIKYILLNDDKTEVINNIASEKEIINGVITNSPDNLIILHDHEYWDNETKSIKLAPEPTGFTGSITLS